MLILNTRRNEGNENKKDSQKKYCVGFRAPGFSTSIQSPWAMDMISSIVWGVLSPVNGVLAIREVLLGRQNILVMYWQ